MKKIILIVIFLSIVSGGICAQEISKEFLEYDYFSHEYKYLDKEFKIKISSEEFQKLIKKHKFFPERIATCKDSLSVVLMGEFNDWHKARIACNRLGFSYVRLGYILWLDEFEAKSLCKRYRIKYPYKLYQYIRYQEENWDNYMKDFIAELKFRIKSEIEEVNTDSMNTKVLLKTALFHNPQRIKDSEAKKAKRAQGDLSCGKKDCCQIKEK